MAGVSFVFDDEAAQAVLNRLERAATHPRGAFERIGAYFVTSTQQNIERETAPDGTKWPRLSPRTANRRLGKGKRGYDHMLRVSARLYQSIASDASDDGVEWGSNLVYARAHQLGAVIQQPAREGQIALGKVRQRQADGSFRLRSRFVRPTRKNAEIRQVSIKAHQVRLPPRPFLGVSAADRVEVEQISIDYLREEVGQ